MSTPKGTTMHPRRRHIGACWYLLQWFQPFSTSQNTSQIQFRTFLKKKNQIFWFPCCSTHEDLSVDVSITYVGLILTKPGRFFYSAYGNSGYGQNSISSISNFLKNFHISGFPWCSTREDHSIDVSITNVGLILTKIRWFQLFVKSQNSNFELFWKKKSNFGSPWCSTREEYSLWSVTSVGVEKWSGEVLLLSRSSDGQTFTTWCWGESSYIWWQTMMFLPNIILSLSDHHLLGIIMMFILHIKSLSDYY